MRRVTQLCAVGLLCAALLSPAAYAQRPGGRGGAGGGGAAGGGQGGPGGAGGQQIRQAFRSMRLIDSYWITLTFELKTDDAKLTELRPKFQAAWDARKPLQEAVRTAMGNQDRDGAAKAVQGIAQINQQLEAAIKQSLGEDQLTKLKEAAAQQGGGFGRGPGGGRGGGQGGGGGQQ